jgi:hypothetical protein
VALRTKDGQCGMILLKLGRRAHLEELRRGLLYMNPLSHFRSLEEDPARRDEREGDDYILQPEHANLVIETGIPDLGRISAAPGDLAGPIRMGAKHSLANEYRALYGEAPTSIKAHMDGC